MKTILSRLAFVVLTTIVLVFFSEKAYWYPTGYVLGGLVLFYAFPVYASLWALDHFRVRRLSALVLCAGLFAFLVEGVLTPVVYEAGLLDPVMPAYFVGWHGLLSVVFGWYYLRKWLVKGQWLRLLAAGAAFGVFWGLWSATFWLPENVAEFQQLAAQGELVLPGAWPAAEYGLHALTFTLVLIGAHWLLGRGVWQHSLSPTRPEKWVLLLGLAFFFAALVFPVLPLAIFKLAALLGLVMWGLWSNRKREAGRSLMSDLVGTAKLSHALVLLVMPLAATLVYALAGSLDVPEPTLRTLLEMIPALQGLLGGGLFLWALAVNVLPGRNTRSRIAPVL